MAKTGANACRRRISGSSSHGTAWPIDFWRLI
jgi:hypothetical protein